MHESLEDCQVQYTLYSDPRQADGIRMTSTARRGRRHDHRPAAVEHTVALEAVVAPTHPLDGGHVLLGDRLAGGLID